jgi:hypothetical protein
VCQATCEAGTSAIEVDEGVILALTPLDPFDWMLLVRSL